MKSNVNEVVETSKYLFEKKLISGKSGNISLRFKNKNHDLIAITPTFKSLKRLNEEDIVLIDMNGNNLTKGKPSSEIDLHLEIYKKREDINGIIHTHSPYATGFSFADKKIERHEGFGEIKEKYLKEIEYEVPGTKKLSIKASKALEDEDILILKKHGVVALGKTLKEACDLAEFVEFIAKTQFISHLMKIKIH